MIIVSNNDQFYLCKNHLHMCLKQVYVCIRILHIRLFVESAHDRKDQVSHHGNKYNCYCFHMNVFDVELYFQSAVT